ncbi:MAG TPA: SDR family oxidoreductase [Solirubrobacteraceae bacterium]|nr:SDR family oxidoreductase [Solirubrobacteraceae bacterium]
MAVVTGGASGIGRASALALAGRGLRVALGDLSEDGAHATAEQAHDARGFRVDVTDQDSVRAFAENVIGELGVPSVLVNCAGWDETHPFLDTNREFWERVLSVNLTGVVAVTHAFLGAMVKAAQGGRIVNIASDAGRVGSSGEAVYAGAKGGVIAFTKSLARETARHGITANAVCPGPTDTPLFRAQPERLQQALANAIPMRRIAKPEEIANAVAFFAAQDTGYVTGQVLSVSGGLTMAG